MMSCSVTDRVRRLCLWRKWRHYIYRKQVLMLEIWKVLANDSYEVVKYGNLHVLHVLHIGWERYAIVFIIKHLL